MSNEVNMDMLKEADEAAVDIINRMKHENGFDLEMAFMTMSVAVGRLRVEAAHYGANLDEVDALFKSHSEAITEAVRLGDEET